MIMSLVKQEREMDSLETFWSILVLTDGSVAE